MKKFLPFLLLLSLAACQPADAPGNLEDVVANLQARALEDDLAWNLLESLTTDVGPRMGGSEGDARAVAWARQNLDELGFDRVWLEHVSFPLWERHSETARVAGDEGFDLAVTALGGSPGTGGVLSGLVVHFENLEQLEAVEPGSLDGRIAFISDEMERARDGSGYGKAVAKRSRGPFVAARKGASALLIRSVGTDTGADAVPHTGMISGSEPGEPVPAAALSNPAADALVKRLQDGPVTVEMALDCGYNGLATSQNVIAEFDGSGATDEFVVVGGHLDSWDLGTGAVDDGAGVAITTAAAKLVADLPERPRRGIRLVLFANEEQGIHGGKAYAQAHSDEVARHVVGAESDLGSGRIYQFRSSVLPTAEPAVAQLEKLLEPLDIPWSRDRGAYGGADLGQMRRLGMPAIDLNHDATDYFDLHHTANDTLDRVDPSDIQFNVAAFVTLVYWAAQSEVVFGPIPASE